MESPEAVQMPPGEPDSGYRSQAALERVIKAAAETRHAGDVRLLAAAARYGESAAAENQPIDQVFESLLRAAQPADAHQSGEILSAAVRGYLDRMVRLRGLVRRGGTGSLSSHVSRLAALYRINQAATASLDLESMLNTVVQVVTETTAGDACSIFLYDAPANALTLRAAIGLNSDAVGRVVVPLGIGITGAAAASRQVLAVSDVRSHPAYADYPSVGDQLYTSQVSVPLALRSPDRLVGVLNILTLTSREFDADEVAFLEMAAGELAIAIENARLYSETDAELRQRISELGTLQQMSRMVASTLDLSELLSLITKQTVELARAVAAEIYRRPNGGTRSLELLARYPPDDVVELQAINDDIRKIVEDVMELGIPVWRLLHDREGDLYVRALPMLTGRRAVGAICVFHRKRPMTERDAYDLLRAFSDSAAIAIENAELYEEARRGLIRVSTLLQEMHHRVRNNLQTVAALLSLQARHAEDAGWIAPLQEAVSRIRSIAVIHDLLSSGNLGETTADTIARHVAEEAGSNIVPPGLHITYVIPPSDVRVSSRQATVLALLINEFVTNAVIHGFAGRPHGRLEIAIRPEGPSAVLEVIDDGVGLPEAFEPWGGAGLGLQIAHTLTEADLGGTLEIARRSTGGTLVRVRFTPNRPAGMS